MFRYIFTDFGFCSYRSFVCSMLRFDSTQMITLTAFLMAFVSNILGLQPYTIKILLVILGFELSFGIWAGIKRFGKFKPKRLERFGLKLLVYTLLLLVLTTMVKQYSESSIEKYLYNTLHSFVVFYIIFVYTISILNNISYLMGGNDEIDNLIRIFKLKLKKKTKELVDSVDDVIDLGEQQESTKRKVVRTKKK